LAERSLTVRHGSWQKRHEKEREEPEEGDFGNGSSQGEARWWRASEKRGMLFQGTGNMRPYQRGVSRWKRIFLDMGLSAAWLVGTRGIRCAWPRWGGHPSPLLLKPLGAAGRRRVGAAMPDRDGSSAYFS
jgi:hypothetical protein